MNGGAVYAAAALAGYLFGSIPFAYILARAKLGIDIRKHGSGNVGATNMWRVARDQGAGNMPGLACFILDLAKGFLPCVIAMRYAGENQAMVAGTCAIVGHVFPIWLRGSGGKGVATAAGAFLALAPIPFLYSFITFLVIGPLATRTISAGSVAAALMLPFMALSFSSTSIAALSTCMGALIIYRHRGNIARLYDGSESRLWSGLPQSWWNIEPPNPAEPVPVQSIQPVDSVQRSEPVQNDEDPS